MPENTIHRLLRETFPKADKEIWQRIASQELGNKDPFKNLIWRTNDDIEFFPYYDESDIDRLDYLKKFRLPIADDSTAGPRKWLCAPLVATVNVDLANKTALDHLSNGADSILFVLTPNIQAEQLLRQIDWPSCHLIFKTKSDPAFFQSLQNFIHQKKFDTQTLTGSLFWESRPKRVTLHFF